ncbi:MAG: dockerin type I repeat-containing protein, partial [Candidatus Zixiibacteriota bacterium]
DTMGAADSEVVEIVVVEMGNQPPVLDSLIDSVNVAAGDTFILHIWATDPDGPSLTLSTDILPTNSDFYDSGNGGGLFRFYPNSTQGDSIYYVTFIASDGFLADSQTVAMRVITYIPGDANGDGIVNSADVVFLINYLYSGGPLPPVLNAADPNADCEINSADLVYLINYLYGGGPLPKYGCVESKE